MARFVKLTSIKGDKLLTIYVNPEHVISVQVLEPEPGSRSAALEMKSRLSFISKEFAQIKEEATEVVLLLLAGSQED